VRELTRRKRELRVLLMSHSPASWWLLPMAPLIAHSCLRYYVVALYTTLCVSRRRQAWLNGPVRRVKKS
jgi:hypothetical protein